MQTGDILRQHNSETSGADKDNARQRIELSRLDAVLFDLDGVVTDTAEVHARAWKRAFDEFLTARAEQSGGGFVPFDPDADYRRYVDGKPRDEGITSFLEARGIRLPKGEADDPPGRETVAGLGNRKNDYYHELIDAEGVRVYGGSVDFIRYLKSSGLKVAVVSSSKNCSAILRAASLQDLFDVQVDGILASDRHLRGKPAADLFREAARQLGVEPSRAAVVEDAVSGVKAGHDGGFALVIGVDHGGAGKALAAGGAEMVLSDLAALDPGEAMVWPDPPSALSQLPELVGRLRGKQVALFFDYDGTLTPIVARPELAILSEEMRDSLSRLAAIVPVAAIISGRGREDLQGLVAVESLVYAGSHGFDIAGPKGLEIEHEEGRELVPIVARAAEAMRRVLDGIPGTLVEDKVYSLSVHYRLVPEERTGEVERIFDETAAAFPELRKTLGKKVFELRPRLAWDKGRAVLWILEALGLDRPQVVPVYFGDDVTDLDAFNALRGRGIGVFVAESPNPTAAQYSLKDPGEVQVFLDRLTASLQGLRP